MQAAPLTPTDLGMQVLKLAAESRFGVPGRSMEALRSILRDRGTEDEVVHNAVQTLEERGWVTVTCPHPRALGNQRLGCDDTTVAITPKGKAALSQLEANAQFNVRMPKLLTRELQDYAEQAHTSMSAAAVEFMLEGVRMAKFPGIDFRWTPTGRFPHITGTGLSAWEMFRIFRDHKEDMKRIRDNYPGFTSEQIHAGVAYARAYIHEMPLRPGKPAFAREVNIS